MTEPPQRPESVPESATWSEDHQLWESFDRDAFGNRHGSYSSFRPDGSLKQKCIYVSGVRSGPFSVYHPSGEVAREGQFVSGELDGEVLAFRCKAPTNEVLRACCVPDAAWLMRAQYSAGRLLSERFFDDHNQLLLSDGSPAPKRPPGLPERAEYDEFAQRWVCYEEIGPTSDQGTLGVLSYFDERGALVQEDTFRDQRRTRVRHFAIDGTLRREEHLDQGGQRHGTYFSRYVDGDRGPYQLEVVEERSEFYAGQPVGCAEFLTSTGERLRRERGRAFGDASEYEHVVFGRHTWSESQWLALAEDLGKQGLMRHALCAVARGSARASSSAALTDWLRAHVLTLLPDRALGLAQDLQQGSSITVAAVLSGLLLGSDPSTGLRLLAEAVPGHTHAAHDFVDAALLLNPENEQAYGTRAMRRLELGRTAECALDAERLALTSPGLAAFIQEYMALLCPEWQFIPAFEPVISSFDGMPECPLQALDRVRHTIQVYATRLLRLREAALLELSDGSRPAWLAPALSELLPDGPVELRCYSAVLIDSSDEGEERSEVQIDETLSLDGVPLLQLQARARREWAGLTWLCWSAGLDRVALPEQLNPPADFSAAASMAIARAARAGDTLLTGGLRARVQGITGFTWEGFEVDELPHSFAQLAFEEYSELRAMFLWLCFAENISPFQSDLRAR